MEERSYHVGDLKNRIVELAIKRIEDVGEDKLSIRELARELGVSKNAPYKHFKSKEELISAVANFGFIKLTEMMGEDLEDTSFIEIFKKITQEYLNFAKKYPAIYRIMFKMTKEETFFKNYENSALKSFEILRQAIVKGVETGEVISSDTYKSALEIWAYIHGSTSFIIDNIGLPFNMNKEDLFNFDILIKGLKK